MSVDFLERSQPAIRREDRRTRWIGCSTAGCVKQERQFPSYHIIESHFGPKNSRSWAIWLASILQLTQLISRQESSFCSHSSDCHWMDSFGNEPMAEIECMLHLDLTDWFESQIRDEASHLMAAASRNALQKVRKCFQEIFTEICRNPQKDRIETVSGWIREISTWIQLETIIPQLIRTWSRAIPEISQNDPKTFMSRDFNAFFNLNVCEIRQIFVEISHIISIGTNGHISTFNLKIQLKTSWKSVLRDRLLQVEGEAVIIWLGTWERFSRNFKTRNFGNFGNSYFPEIFPGIFVAVDNSFWIGGNHRAGKSGDNSRKFRDLGATCIFQVENFSSWNFQNRLLPEGIIYLYRSTWKIEKYLEVNFKLNTQVEIF